MLPEGGAMIILEYWCLDVFRPDSYQNVKFGAD